MKPYHLLLISFFAVACSAGPPITPGIHIREVRFITEPHIVKREGDFFLEYQVDKRNDPGFPRLMTDQKLKNGKLYFLFVGKVSFPEPDQVVSIPLIKNEQVQEAVKNGLVYWLNPDKSEVKLVVPAG